nr:VWA domain-containing protein [Acidobacteriota bacterium]
IEQFYMVTHDPVTRVSMIAADEGGRPAEAAHRLFLLIFDEHHLASDSLMRVRKGAEAFVMAHIGPGDAAGVLVNGELYQNRLTTDKGALLAGVRAAKPAIETRQSLLAPFREWPRIPSESDALRVAQGARELRADLAAAACRQDPVLCEIEGRADEVQNVIERKARTYVREARRLTGQTISTLNAVSDSLSKFAGRKTVVLMTEGFFAEDSRATVERTAARAARAGVTIYTIDGRGLTSKTGIPDVTAIGAQRSEVFDTGEDGPSILAAGTGGMMVRNLDDVTRAFGMVARDTSTYYVIGYSPTRAKMDGKFRRIEVKANPAGLEVRARRGYMATELPPQETIWKR